MMLEPARQRHSDNQIDTPQGVEGPDNGCQRPAWQELIVRRLDPFDAFFGYPHGVDKFLQSDLVGGILKTLLLKPPQVAHRPTLLARENPSVLQHEGANLLPVDAPGLNRCGPRTNQVPHRFMPLVGNPDRRLLASAEKLGQAHCIAPVGLHPVAGPPRDQRQRRHVAGMA